MGDAAKEFGIPEGGCEGVSVVVVVSVTVVSFVLTYVWYKEKLTMPFLSLCSLYSVRMVAQTE